MSDERKKILTVTLVLGIVGTITWTANLVFHSSVIGRSGAWFMLGVTIMIALHAAEKLFLSD